MNFRNLKRLTATAGFGLVALLGASVVTDAQTYKQIRKEEKRIEKQQRRIDREERREDNMRYRVYRNGGYYYTDNRGAELLRQAVNRGYQQGYQAGRYDSSRRSRYGWDNSSMYRSGNYGYERYVDSGQYRYYFQQGFQRGYEDGYYSRNRYGSSGVNILGNILQGILNISSY
jgi:flagellar biosynthesis/type III secretory pathway protein FliH